MRKAGVPPTIRIVLLAGLLLLGMRPMDVSAAEPTTLPLSKIVLYSSGVGYFQHDGTVRDRAQVHFNFNASQVNDLLKSLVVQDFSGGTISAVTYGSRDPVTKTLGAFPINLNGNPTLGQILNQVRGELIEIAAPNPVTGTLLGIEKKTESIGEGPQRRILEQEYLNLLTDEGFRAIPLAQLHHVKLANEALNRELHQALTVLATNHDTQKKSLSISFDGSGARQARVAYLNETPVWKTSYRLVLEENKAPFLQGWAIVENTTEQDWTNVALSLVSGRPISFIMDLYQPLYNPRPLVEPQLYSSLRPQTYGDAVELGAVGAAPSQQEGKKDLAGLKRGKMEGRLNAPAEVPASMAAKARAESDALSLQEGVSASASGQDTGELFEYRMNTPVTLARHTSALLPILNQEVQGQKVSIYNQSVNNKHPLNGIKLKNTTALHLMEGPITLFDGGAYAGDARIEDLPPGQDRLVSYALDLKTEVEPKLEGGTQELVAVAIKKGTMQITRRLVEDRTFLVNNRDQKTKSILIEHPYRADWKLMEPKEPAERTRDVYRFTISVDAGKTATLRVKESLPVQESIHLMDSGMDQIAIYQQAREVSGKVKEALQRVASLRSKLDETKAQRARGERRVTEITAEHARIRDNMQRLAQSSELYGRYVKKLDQQETELEKLRREIEALKNVEEDQRRELQAYIMNLEVS